MTISHNGSKTRIAVSVVLVVICFVWLSVFFFYSVAPSFLMIWINAVVGVSFFYLGICIGFRAEIRHAAWVYLLLMAWAVGMFFIPVPEGYANEVYGIYLFGLGGLVALYERLRKKVSSPQSRQNNAT